MTKYQLIRTDAEGSELVCGNGDLGAKVYSEHHVRDMVTILNAQHPQFKYSYRELPDPTSKLSKYDRFCLYFGFLFVPIVCTAVGVKLVIWWFQMAWALFEWMVN